MVSPPPRGENMFENRLGLVEKTDLSIQSKGAKRSWSVLNVQARVGPV